MLKLLVRTRLKANRAPKRRKLYQKGLRGIREQTFEFGWQEGGGERKRGGRTIRGVL